MHHRCLTKTILKTTKINVSVVLRECEFECYLEHVLTSHMYRSDKTVNN